MAEDTVRMNGFPASRLETGVRINIRPADFSWFY